MTRQKSNNMLKRWLFVAFGTLLGLFFLYLAFRDISWSDFVGGLTEMKPIYFLPATVLLLFIQLVRAMRFGVIVRPFSSMRFKDLWDLLNIWAGLNMLMPARLGELVRPYLLRLHQVPFSRSFGAVMVERFFDLLGLLLLLALVLWTSPQVPRVYSLLGQALLVILAFGYAVVLLVLARRDKVQVIVERLLSRLPDRIASFLGGIFRRLLDGVGIMASWKHSLIIFLYSVCIWGLFSVLTYLFLLAFSLKAPFLVAVTIQVFLCLGVALPSAPGFVGTFHAAGRYALALFGVKAAIAVPFATVYHLFNLTLSVLICAFSYWTGDFRLDRGVLYSEPSQQNSAAETMIADRSSG